MYRNKHSDIDSKTICLLVNDIATDFSKSVIHGAAESIPDNKEVHLVVLAGFYDYGGDISDKRHRYNYVYNSIYKMAELGRFDGLIFSFDKAGYKVGMQNDEYLRRFGDIPMVFVATEQEGCVTVNYDNETGMKEMIDCLMNFHRFTKIGMLGGRDDNSDARKRKEIFIRNLREYGIEFSEEYYEKTDMSINSEQAAARLIDRVPDIQAIFCVNDATAVGLYSAMSKKGLVPGENIMVIGFDNTHLAEELQPSLTSIGSDTVALGQKAMELILKMSDGEQAESAAVRTRLYGRESMRYESYEYTTQELLNIDHDFIYRMFDDCFYRYSSEHISREQVNLRRLFFEFISGMIYAMGRSYMSAERFIELSRMIDIFFAHGATRYTDVTKLIKSIVRLQDSMNRNMAGSGALTQINRLFTRMRDKALNAISCQHKIYETENVMKREALHNFIVSSMCFDHARNNGLLGVIKSFGQFGFKNAALCFYEKPIEYYEDKVPEIPGHINVCCVIKDGEQYVIPGERQRRNFKDLFDTDEFFARCSTNMVFPVFYGNKVYGMIICELTDEIYDNGEFIAAHIGMAVNIAELSGSMETC